MQHKRIYTSLCVYVYAQPRKKPSPTQMIHGLLCGGCAQSTILQIAGVVCACPRVHKNQRAYMYMYKCMRAYIMLSHRASMWLCRLVARARSINGSRAEKQPHQQPRAHKWFCMPHRARVVPSIYMLRGSGGQTGIFVCSIQIRNHWLLTPRCCVCDGGARAHTHTL